MYKKLVQSKNLSNFGDNEILLWQKIVMNLGIKAIKYTRNTIRLT